MATAGGDEHSDRRSPSLSNLRRFLLLIDSVELPLRYEETGAVGDKDRGGENHGGDKDKGSGEIQGNPNEKEGGAGKGGPRSPNPSHPSRGLLGFNGRGCGGMGLRSWGPTGVMHGGSPLSPYPSHPRRGLLSFDGRGCGMGLGRRQGPARVTRGRERRRGTWWDRRENRIAVEGMDFAQDTEEGGADDFEFIPSSDDGVGLSSLSTDDEFVPETEPQEWESVALEKDVKLFEKEAVPKENMHPCGKDDAAEDAKPEGVNPYKDADIGGHSQIDDFNLVMVSSLIPSFAQTLKRKRN